MCKYAYLKGLESRGILTEGVREGVIKINDVNKMRIYEDWLDLSNVPSKEDRKAFVSVQNSCSISLVEKVVKNFGC